MPTSPLDDPLADISASDRTVTRQDNSAVAESGVAAEELKQFIERIERLEEEKAGIAEDIKEVFAELKGRGFDAKVTRQLLRIRKQDAAERQEQEAILDLYMQALGMA
jgi:uncharacterized protein (UPF0335 family)